MNDDETKYVATITQSQSSMGWDGVHTDSTSVVGALVQKDGETYEAFKARVEAKIAELDAKTGYKGRKQYYGLNSDIHWVFED